MSLSMRVDFAAAHGDKEDDFKADNFSCILKSARRNINKLSPLQNASGIPNTSAEYKLTGKLTNEYDLLDRYLSLSDLPTFASPGNYYNGSGCQTGAILFYQSINPEGMYLFSLGSHSEQYFASDDYYSNTTIFTDENLAKEF